MVGGELWELLRRDLLRRRLHSLWRWPAPSPYIWSAPSSYSTPPATSDPTSITFPARRHDHPPCQPVLRERNGGMDVVVGRGPRPPLGRSGGRSPGKGLPGPGLIDLGAADSPCHRRGGQDLFRQGLGPIDEPCHNLHHDSFHHRQIEPQRVRQQR